MLLVFLKKKYSIGKYLFNTNSKMWETNFNPEDYKRPIKLSFDLIDSKNNKKILLKGEKLNFVIAKKLQEKGLKSVLVSREQIIGKYSETDIQDKSGEKIVSAGFDITEDQLEKIIQLGDISLNLVNVDPINKGPYLLETLKVDKNLTKPDELGDIYKVLRPGEAPSIEIAEEIFNNLYFKKEKNQ